MSASQVTAWKRELNGARPAASRAATLHIWLGECELAQAQQPGPARWHFRQAQRLVPSSASQFGLAGYDAAICHYYEGAYQEAEDDFRQLLTPETPLAGYDRRSCALWARHAGACAAVHISNGKLGIPEPPRLDPLCGAASLAACLHSLALPYDRKSVLASCRVTGEGSTLQDVLSAARRLGTSARAVTADDQGLIGLPKPLVAYVEHDHFVAVVRADRRGVSYLCADCGPWPGGQVDLTWNQWHALNARLYAVITRPGSRDDRDVRSALAGSGTVPIRVAAAGRLTGLGASLRLARGAAASLMREHVVMYQLSGGGCGVAFYALHCPPYVTCPMDTPPGPCGSDAGDPVNLATGEEEYAPAPDLVVYNPHGPAVAWQRIYNSLRPSTGDSSFVYEDDDFGGGWSQPYNGFVYDPGTSSPHANPQLLPGGAIALTGSGSDPTAAQVWDIVSNGTTVATSEAPNGWGVSRSVPNLYVNAPASAPSAPGCEVRFGGAGGASSAYFDLVSQYTVAQGALGIMAPSGQDANTSGQSWDIVQGGNTIANDQAPHGWSVGLHNEGFYITAPFQALVGSNYEVRFGPTSAFFNVVPCNLAVAAGGKYLVMPNGARIPFTAPAVPTSSNPSVSCATQPGTDMLVEWDYDGGSPYGHYRITMPDRSRWVTNPPSASVLPSGSASASALCYQLRQVLDRNGNGVTLTYGSLGPSGFPLLSGIVESASGASLLTLQRNGNGGVVSVSDRYGRSVYYQQAGYTGLSGGGEYSLSYSEVSQVSQIVPTGTASPPARWSFGYQMVSAGDVPFLHAITAPSPTGTGTTTATINYSGCVVSSLVDGNGNTRMYTALDGGHTRVTTTDPKGHTLQSYTVGFDSNMSMTSKTDGAGNVVYSASYADPNDPYQPSAVTDGNGYGSLTPGGTARITATGHDWDGGFWSIRLNGDFVYSQQGGSGEPWSVDYEGGAFTITAPPGAQISSGYEVRYASYFSGVTASAYFSVSANKGTTSYVWDQFGNLHQETSPRGTVTNYTYGFPATTLPSVVNSAAKSDAFPLGELLSIQEGGKASTSFSYLEPSGLVQSVTGPSPTGMGTVTGSMTYDGLGNVRTAVAPGNNAATTITTAFDYGPSPAIGQPLTVTDNLGKSSHVAYDAQGNPTSVTDALGNETDFGFIEPGGTVSLTGQLQSVTLPATGQTGSGQARRVNVYLYPGGPLTGTTAYDESGNAVRRVSYRYGPEGETLGVSGSAEPVGYTYDALYRLRSLSDGNGQATRYFYNPAGYLSGVVYPGGDTVQLPSYDKDGNVLQRLDGRGVETDYVYDDPESLLTAVHYQATPSLDVGYGYDGYGRRSTMTDGSGGASYTYDDLDALTGVTTTYTGLPSKTVSYGYYPDGSRQTMITPGGAFSYTYDADGRPAGLSNPFSQATALSYLDNGWLHTQQMGNGVTSTYAYDAVGQLLDLAHRTSGGGLLSEFGGMGYDGAGNRTAMRATVPGLPGYGGVTSYLYDAKDQLLQEQSTRIGGYTNAFGYDAAGNPATFRGGGHGFNANNQDTAFTYDGNGNPISYKGVPLTFDPENRLVTNGH